MTGTQHNRRGRVRRAALVDAAARCFAARPFDEVTMEDIAAEAGAAKGLAFYYFGSKRDCYLAVIERFSEQMAQAASPEADLSPVQRLALRLDDYLDFVESSPEGYLLLIRGGLGSDEEARVHITTQRDFYRSALLDLVLEGAPVPPLLRVACEGYMSFVEGATLDWLTHRGTTRQLLHRLLVESAGSALVSAVLSDPGLLEVPAVRRAYDDVLARRAGAAAQA